MRVRATALGTERSNAIGVVELECAPQGLCVSFLGVGAFQDGYAPAALNVGTQLIVPWGQVQEARLDGEQLYLALDPSLTTLSRLVLVGFSTGELPHERELARQRLLLRLGALGAGTVALLVALLSVPRLAPRAGGAVALGIGAGVAALIASLGWLAERRLGRPAEGLAVREGFVAELASYLPELRRSPSAPHPRRAPLTLPSFQRALPRTVLALALTFTGVGLASLLVWKQGVTAERTAMARGSAPWEQAPTEAPVAAPEPEAPALPTATAAPAPEPSAAVAAPPALPGQLAAGEACRCERASSPLWSTPPSQLGLVLLSRRLVQDGTRPRLFLELAAVNAGATELKELALRVDFIERQPAPSVKVVVTSSRALYFEGPLGPGAAIKWSLDGRGADYRIDNPYPAPLTPDTVAPASALAELLRANHRPVRLYGAMLLAWLGDARGREGALALLDAQRDEESVWLRRVVEATGPLRVCELRVSSQGEQRVVEACVHNVSDARRGELGLGLRALGGALQQTQPTADAPTELGWVKFPLTAPLQPGEGRRVQGRVELHTEDAPTAWEAIADELSVLR